MFIVLWCFLLKLAYGQDPLVNGNDTGRIIKNTSAYTEKQAEARAGWYTGGAEWRNNKKEAAGKKLNSNSSASVSDSRNWSSESCKLMLHSVDYSWAQFSHKDLAQNCQALPTAGKKDAIQTLS